jgi:hypothetical protein
MFDQTNQYDISIVINGNPLTEYYHSGNVFVEGRTNSNYEIQIKNNSPERILAIPSVDGLSVVDGKLAGADSPGYVLEPWQTLNIPGWKVDGATAAKFQFGSSTGSYSNRTGRGKKNVGVVGMMVFRPKYVPPAPTHFYPSTHTFTGLTGSLTTPSQPMWNNMMGSGVSKSASDMDGGFGGVAMAAAPGAPTMRSATINASSVVGSSDAVPKSAQNLGTEYGSSTSFETSKTTFEKRDPNHPDALVAIYYDDANGLEARGIILPYRSSSPQAFPTYSNSSTYAAPPPGWTKK